VQHVCKDTLDVQERTLMSQGEVAAQHDSREPELGLHECGCKSNSSTQAARHAVVRSGRVHSEKLAAL
jgi:hypothetical protein